MYQISRALSTSSRCFLLTIPTSTARHLVSPHLRSRPPFDQVHSRLTMTDTNQGGDPSKKTYRKKATGNALTTVKNHSKDDDIKLYGSAFWYVTMKDLYFRFTTTNPTPTVPSSNAYGSPSSTSTSPTNTSKSIPTRNRNLSSTSTLAASFLPCATAPHGPRTNPPS